MSSAVVVVGALRAKDKCMCKATILVEICKYKQIHSKLARVQFLETQIKEIDPAMIKISRFHGTIILISA